MRYLPNGYQMKEADRYTIQEIGIPSLELMENASASCVEVILNRNLDCSKVCVVCGSGNNGGDGFAIARMLVQRGFPVTVVLVGNPDRCTEETKVQIALFEQTGHQISNEFHKDEYSIIIDAIFGVGLSRPIEGRYKNVIEDMNQSSGIKIAVDIPSGISADNGAVLGIAFQADLTVTFQTEKVGLCLYPGKEYAGEVIVTNIGITEKTLKDDLDVAYTHTPEEYKRLLPVRKADSHKGTNGKLLIIAGCKGMSGAAFLNAMAAYKTGAGLVQIYTVEENRAILQTLLPEAIISTYEKDLSSLLKWADAVCIGSGIGTSDVSRNILKTTIENVTVSCVIDADGLNLLSENPDYLEKKLHGDYVITPHMKEMSRLTGKDMKTIKENRMDVVKEYTEEHDLTCVLKDSRTVVRGKNERTYVNLSGNAAMAKGGSGDVLTGVIGGLLAQGLNCKDAAVLGTYLHGRAGDFTRDEKGSYSVMARDLTEQLGNVLKEEEKQ